MKKKIALIIRGFHCGGIEKVFELYFSHMDLSPYEIHIITNMENMPERQEIFEKMGCIIHTFSPMRGHRFTWKNIVEYKNLFRSEKFDIVHNNVPDNLFPLYFAKKYDVPIRILHAHTIYTDDFASKKKMAAMIFRKGFAINTSNATKLVAVSGLAAKSAFAKKSGEAIILKNAINLENFSFNLKAREQIRNHLDVAASEVLIGHVGRYENDMKNQEFVLTVFGEIIKKYDNCKLVMLGEGPRRSGFIEMARRLNILEKVIFTGAVFNVNEYLSAMDIFLLPSRKEGFGIVGVEAQASGVMCIFSDKIPQEALITDQVTVIGIEGEQAVFNWKRQIEEWLPNILLRGEDVRKKAVELIRDAGYDIHTQTRQLECLYQENC